MSAPQPSRPAAAAEQPELARHIPLSGVREPRSLWATRRAAHGLIRAVFRLRLHGLEHIPADGPLILAGNHSSFLDGPFVFITLPRPSAFLIKSEIFQVGWLARFLHLIRQIPINRGKPDRTALRRGLQVLADGGVLGVFPEGTRGSGALETVQHGIGYIALKAGCPVVPVVCFGTADALPKHHVLPRLRTPIDIVFGPAFTVARGADVPSRQAFADAAEEVRRHMLDHLVAAARATGRPTPAVRRT